MIIAIGSDHTGMKLKNHIISNYKEIEFNDVGAYSEESTDYPDWISKVGLEIQNKGADMGIAICGTGIGASITANKMRGIRAALCMNSYMSEMARRHNDANILVLGARVLGEELAINIIDSWFKFDFEGDRHLRRVNKITELECSQYK